jgi:hypothetical protein
MISPNTNTTNTINNKIQFIELSRVQFGLDSGNWISYVQFFKNDVSYNLDIYFYHYICNIILIPIMV